MKASALVSHELATSRFWSPMRYSNVSLLLCEA